MYCQKPLLIKEKGQVEDERPLKTVESNVMDKLRAEMKIHVKMQFDQFVQSQVLFALNDLIHRQEEQFLLVEQTVTKSNKKMSKLESDMEVLKKTVEVYSGIDNIFKQDVHLLTVWFFLNSGIFI